MGGTIGGASFQFDLHWVTQFEGHPVASQKTAIDGTIVTCMAGAPAGSITPNGIHTFKFTWASQAQLAVLKSLAANPTMTFSISTGIGEPSVSARCVAKNALKYQPVVNYEGFTDGQVKDGPHDLYDGEIKVIVLP